MLGIYKRPIEVTTMDMSTLKMQSIVSVGIRKEFLSRIVQIHYWRLFSTTYEHYNYLQLTKVIKMENSIQKVIKGWA